MAEQVHAKQTEVYLVGKSLRDTKTLQGALETLDKELVPDHRPPDASREYRKSLAKNLVYKVSLIILLIERLWHLWCVLFLDCAWNYWQDPFRQAQVGWPGLGAQHYIRKASVRL